jgi:hypothetical protein
VSLDYAAIARQLTDALAPSDTFPTMIDCAGKARESTSSEGARRPLRYLPTVTDCAGKARARTRRFW